MRDEDLQRRLAVKVLRADIPWSPATLARFKQEARAIARLSHPNTLPIHFVGEAEGLVFYVMPFCEGRTAGRGAPGRRARCRSVARSRSRSRSSRRCSTPTSTAWSTAT